MENALLRQQLIVASRKVKRPIFKAHERGFLVLLASLMTHWRNVLLLVKPDTVLRWHREGFRLFWRLKSRNTKSPHSRVDPDIIALIRRMAAENVLWGAERIRGELLKLGIRVSMRKIQRHMTNVRPPGLPRGQTWRTFLRNEVDSHATLAKVTAPFVPWLRFKATPILDVKESAQITGEALSWLSSLT